MSWIDTYSGQRFKYQSMDVNAIDIKDIAIGLANLCRFSGQCIKFYSVAQHSILASYYVPEELALQALLHDAAETYISDVPRPLKRLLPELVKIEESIIKRIFFKFGVDYPISKEVKEVDIKLLLAEQEILFEDQKDWGFNVEPFDKNPLEGIKIWAPGMETALRFASRFDELKEKE